MNSHSKSTIEEEACVAHYLRDRARIEQQQDETKKQRKLLQEIDEQIQLDVKREYDRLDSYADTQDIHLYHKMIACKNQIYQIQTQAHHGIEEAEEELAMLDHKLSSELEEREEKHEQELRTLNEPNGGN